MSISTVIDVGIGLIFVFLLLGLVVSALQEAVASLLALRGKYLLEGISTLLADNKGGYWLAKAHILPWSSTAADIGSDLFRSVAGHALIKGITPADTPSYVPAANFATALIDALRNGGIAPAANQVEAAIATLPEGPARQALSALFAQAKGDIDVFRKSVETWFDTSMDRVSGVYKRWTQYFALIAGFTIAVALNVSTIAISDALLNNPPLREAAVKAATAYIEECDSHPDACAAAAPAAPAASGTAAPPEDGSNPVQTATKKTEQTKAIIEQVSDQLSAIGYPAGWKAWPDSTFNWPVAILGWLITALAVSLGAPFWFGLLKTFLNIRGAGANPAEKKPST